MIANETALDSSHTVTMCTQFTVIVQSTALPHTEAN